MENRMGVVLVNDGGNKFEVVLDYTGRNEGARRVITFGRSPDCDIVLRSSNVSRNHGCFFMEDGMYYIEDHNSTNGLVLAGNKIKKNRLSQGNIITIPKSHKGNSSEGDVSFTFMLKENEQPQQERIVENEVLVEKTVKYIPKWAIALMAVCGALIIGFILYGAVFSKARYEPKGSYTAYEYDYDDDEKESQEGKLIFDKGTYVWWYDTKKTCVVDIGTYEVENGIVSMTSLHMDNDGKKADEDDLSPEYKLLYDGHSGQLAFDEDFIWERDDKKEGLDFSIDADYITDLNNRLDFAAEKSIDAVGMEYINECYHGQEYIYLGKDELTRPGTKFEDRFVDEIEYEDDETLQYLIEHEMIHFEVYSEDDADIWFANEYDYWY